MFLRNINVLSLSTCGISCSVAVAVLSSQQLHNHVTVFIQPPPPPLAVPSSLGSSSIESSISSESDERLEGVGTFIMAGTVFLRLIQAESRLMTQIIPASHHKAVLDELTKRPIEFFMRDGEVNIKSN